MVHADRKGKAAEGMSDISAACGIIDELLPERLDRLQRVSGLPVVFGGTRRRDRAGNRLVISRLSGTVGNSLSTLAVRPGAGLGGAVLSLGETRRVDDYASASTITHDYDRIVVDQEHLTSIVAVPVIISGRVEGIIYGAVRDRGPIGDRSLRAAEVVADLLGRDVEERMAARFGHRPPLKTDALTELAAIIRDTDDEFLRNRLVRVHRELSGSEASELRILAPTLTVREAEVLELAAIGATNLVIAAELGIGSETVKSYLGSAMRKLDASNRTAAVSAARSYGLISNR